MALKIENGKIVGTIDNLEDKLNGEIQVTREELLVLVNSWGRAQSFYIFDINQDIDIEECKAKECYDLSKLDTSGITNMDDVFIYSLFEGDISQWNTSNVTSMNSMFNETTKFNGDIGNWDVSNVTSMYYMFGYTDNYNQPLNNWNTSNLINMEAMFCGAESFNQDISNWDISNVTSMFKMFANTKVFNQNISKWNLDNIKNCDYILDNTKAFEIKYNNNKSIPYKTKEIKEWIINNRDKMNDIDIKEKYGKEVDGFFSNITDIYSTNRIGLHENLLTECNKLCL